MKTSLREVALRAGVSISTVSRALNGTARVDPETRERIRAAMHFLNYHPLSDSAGSVSTETRLLGFLMPEGMQALGLNTSVYGAVANAVRVTAEASGYGVTIGTYTNGSDMVTVGDRLLVQKGIDAAVLFRTRLADESFDRFRDCKLPFIVVGRLFDRDPVHCVGVDHRQAGYLAARHLVSLGHRRIAFVGGPRNVASTILRLEGFRNALREANITVSEDWLVESNYDPQLAAKLTRQMMANPQRPTAILAGNDRVGWAIVRALQQEGLSVPADVSVIGFDDAEESAHFTPPLTTVRIEWKQMAEIATYMLIEILRRGTIRRVYITLETQLIVRESTAPPKP